MKILLQTKIEAPINLAATLMVDPSNTKYWMKDLINYKQVRGKPGAPGSTARYVFKNGSQHMVFTATVGEQRLPYELHSRLDATNVSIAVTARFRALSPTTTLYTSEQIFSFKGWFNKAVGVFAKGAIKARQEKHMRDFKLLAEGKTNL